MILPILSGNSPKLYQVSHKIPEGQNVSDLIIDMWGTIYASKIKAAELMLEGHVVFSPITHGHAIAERHDLPLEFEWWSKQCFEFLRLCSKVVVLRLEGHASSVGVNAELEVAHLRDIPVEWVDP